MSALMKTLMRKGNATHVALYRRTGGRHFSRIRGLPVCLLDRAWEEVGNTAHDSDGLLRARWELAGRG